MQSGWTQVVSLGVLIITMLANWPAARAAETSKPSSEVDTSIGDRLVHQYFAQRTADLTARTREILRSARNWEQESEPYRKQLLEMLGLDPLPERTPLHPVVTKTLIREDFVVENIQFQSSPGLYVTGNLYRPKDVTEKVPGILYVCGHAGMKIDGVNYGNKTHYHFHGAWLARHGYVCLIIDSLQLGEIAGLHHGTYNLGQWWWLSRGYTPAGVEAWNCTRALDYLESRPEVDAERLGVTGRSGGGAYSWWIAAIDKRVKCAVPVAGITSLDDHVAQGCVEGHCDCMFMVNTYQWDYPLVAGLVAPRPLLISNTDKDKIFPLEGVVDTYLGARHAYRTLHAGDSLGLQITEGGHNDTQELRIHAMVWFDRFLRKAERPITIAASQVFSPQELKVFPALPEDQLNSRIQEQFVPMAPEPEIPASRAEWDTQVQTWTAALLSKTFRAWPGGKAVEPLAVAVAKPEGGSAEGTDSVLFTSQSPYRFAMPRSGKGTKVRLEVIGTDQEWADPKPLEEGVVVYRFAPRGVGPTAWSHNERKRTQIRRRFMLLGETDDGMRVWDVRRAIQALRSTELHGPSTTIEVTGSGDAAVWVLYAALFEEAPLQLSLKNLPLTHMEGPALLNVLKTLDIPQALAIAHTRHGVSIESPQNAAHARWQFPAKVAAQWRFSPNP